MKEVPRIDVEVDYGEYYVDETEREIEKEENYESTTNLPNEKAVNKFTARSHSLTQKDGRMSKIGIFIII